MFFNFLFLEFFNPPVTFPTVKGHFQFQFHFHFFTFFTRKKLFFTKTSPTKISNFRADQKNVTQKNFSFFFQVLLTLTGKRNPFFVSAIIQKSFLLVFLIVWCAQDKTKTMKQENKSKQNFLQLEHKKSQKLRQSLTFTNVVSSEVLRCLWLCRAARRLQG